MLSEETDHVIAVEAWLAPARNLPAAQLLDLFERALLALWKRAHRALGEVTLTAIGDRVVHIASEQYPLLKGLKIERGAIRLDALRSGTPKNDEIVDAIRFVLVELLTVLGSLTAEILTPALHAELATVTLSSREEARRDQRP